MRPNPSNPILIAGPTASGKSALALALAERLDGVVINADSMQVYAHLPILSAQPTAAEQGRAPHRLYGHVAPQDAYSAAHYYRDAARAIKDATESGRVPIVAGGTGLYFKVLLEGLSPVPEIPAEIRAFWRAEALRRPATDLHSELAKRDPKTAARLKPTDRQRVTRALEVIEATGQGLADWQQIPGTPILHAADCRKIVLHADRNALWARCDERFDAMMTAGALAEAAAFMTLNVPADRPAWGTLGLRPLAMHLTANTSLTAAVEDSKRTTRQFVKRQQTWLKRHMISWSIVHTQFSERSNGENIPMIDVALKLL